MIEIERKKGRDGKTWFKVRIAKYNQLAFRSVKQIPGAIYNQAMKVFAVPESSLPHLMALRDNFILDFKDEKIPFNGGIDEETIPKKPIADGYYVRYGFDNKIIDSRGFKTPPWGMFQVRGFNAVFERNFLILADEPGTGKTWQVATAIEAKKRAGMLKRGIVLTKATLLYNWQEEIHKHTFESAIVLNPKDRDKTIAKLSKDDTWTFLIMSYETYRIALGAILLLHQYKPLDFMILDEGHKAKNPLSGIGKAIHQLDVKYKYVLTASPIINNPLDAYNFLKWGGVTKLNWYQFRNKYAVFGGQYGTQILAYKNLSELKSLLQQHMLRRRKEDVLKDLPDVVIKEVKVKMSPDQAKVYKAVEENIEVELAKTEINKITHEFARLTRLQQVADHPALIGAKAKSAKIEFLDSLLEDLIEEAGQKVIVFSKFKELVNILADRYKKYNPAIVTGDTNSSGPSKLTAIKRLNEKYNLSALSKEEYNRLLEREMTSPRQKEVHRFQEDPECKLFIATSPASREGLTLTAATHVVFVDLEWTWEYFVQAYSRAHRIGQKDALTVHVLLAEGTVDEMIRDIVMSKKSMTEFIVETRAGR